MTLRFVLAEARRRGRVEVADLELVKPGSRADAARLARQGYLRRVEEGVYEPVDGAQWQAPGPGRPRRAKDPYVSACRDCDAKAGQPCLSAAGWPSPTYIHKARLRSNAKARRMNP